MPIHSLGIQDGHYLDFFLPSLKALEELDPRSKDRVRAVVGLVGVRGWCWNLRMRIFMFNKKSCEVNVLEILLALLLSVKEGVHRSCPKALLLTLDYEVAVEKTMSHPPALCYPLSTPGSFKIHLHKHTCTDAHT